jgi:beta-barrel assembly-enhancing protease
MRRAFMVAAAPLAFALGACAVSQQQEVQMGQQYSQQINQELPIVQDAEINRYINVLGDSIARLTKRSDLEWHFFVVDSKEVNAFAVPGGYIYVNRGLIERADKMDELAGAIGHEIGHVVRRHTVKQMQQQQTAGIGIQLGCILLRACQDQASQAAINLGAGALFAKFSRQDETEADQEGFKNVVSAGISPEGMVSLFQKLLEERASKPAGVDAWFQTHPLEESRIADVQGLINTLQPAQLARLSTDSRAYQSFKARIMSLPPSPAVRAQ